MVDTLILPKLPRVNTSVAPVSPDGMGTPIEGGETGMAIEDIPVPNATPPVAPTPVATPPANAPANAPEEKPF